MVPGAWIHDDRLAQQQKPGKNVDQFLFFFSRCIYNECRSKTNLSSPQPACKIIAGIPPTPVYLYTRPVAYFQHIQMHIYNLFYYFLVFFPASPLSPV